MKGSGSIISLQNVSVNIGGSNILNNINFEIRQGEQWAIIGLSGSGKTTLANALAGKIFYSGTIEYTFPENWNHGKKVMLIGQQHKFKNLSNTSEFYYQQRFNSSDAENSITVLQALEDFAKQSGHNDIQHWIDLLQLNALLNEPLIQLSNGENKRLQLAEALLTDPGVLIMDNPFIGLDKNGRRILADILNQLTSGNLQFILITTPDELPESITNVAELKNGSLRLFTRNEYDAVKTKNTTAPLFELDNTLLDKE